MTNTNVVTNVVTNTFNPFVRFKTNQDNKMMNYKVSEVDNFRLNLKKVIVDRGNVTLIDNNNKRLVLEKQYKDIDMSDYCMDERRIEYVN